MHRHFFDIGANDGNTFDLFLNKAKEYHGWNVWCFEPSPKHMNSLLAKAKEASDTFKVFVCPFGLSGKTEVLPFYEMVNNTVSDSFIPVGLFATLDTDPKYRVVGSCVSASDFIRAYTSDIDEIVLKVDCEGSEYGLYENLLANPDILSRIKKIYNEWHPAWRDMDPGRRTRAENIISGFSKHRIKLDNWEF